LQAVFPDPSGITLGVVGIVAGGLLTSFIGTRGNDLSRKSLDLEQWTAEKEFREACEKSLVICLLLVLLI